MSNCRVLCMLAVLTALLSISVVFGGPVRTSASRAVKIPRAIRAPFRNNEMMTARGFGKRSHQTININQEGELIQYNFKSMKIPTTIFLFL